MTRLLIVGIVLLVLGVAVVVKPRTGILATFFFLAILGDFRRVIGTQVGFVQIDTILLIEPIIAVLLFLMAVVLNRVRLDTTLSKWIAALSGLMTLEVFNPRQGGIVVGLAGSFFFIVPMLWFWIGKAFGSAQMIERVALRIVVPLAVLAAILGIYQIYFGPLPFEQKWATARGYSALWVGSDTIRAIGFFTSSAEYAHYLSIAMILIWAGWLAGRRTLIVIWPFLAVALFLETSREPILLTLFASAALWAIQGRSRAAWLPRMGVAMVIGASALIFGLSHMKYTSFGYQADTLVAHQVDGILHPTDPRASTADIHADMMMRGLRRGFTQPLGSGLGSTSLAASKMDGHGGSTEVDLSNMMVSLGLLGGIVYLGVIISTLLAAAQFWRQQRSYAALAILGILLLMAGAWLNGGEYSVAALIWFFIGTLDRCTKETKRVRTPAPRAGYA